MKTAQQWFDEMKARPCVTENDLLVTIQRIQADARADLRQELLDMQREHQKELRDAVAEARWQREDGGGLYL